MAAYLFSVRPGEHRLADRERRRMSTSRAATAALPLGRSTSPAAPACGANSTWTLP